MRHNRIVLVLILAFSFAIVPVHAVDAFATYPFSLDELVLVYAHPLRHQEIWNGVRDLNIDALYTEIQENVDAAACTGVAPADVVDIANCLLSETLTLNQLGGAEEFTISLASLFGLQADIVGCMTKEGPDAVCLEPVIQRLLDAQISGAGDLTEMHPCVDTQSNSVRAGCIIEGLMMAQIHLLLANGLQDWIMSAVQVSGGITNAVKPPEIVSVRSEHFVDPNFTNGFSVVFVTLDFGAAADTERSPVAQAELNQKRSRILTWSTLAMEQWLRPDENIQTQQGYPSGQVGAVYETIGNPPDGVTGDNLILGLNVFATGAQSQGPGFGGPGSRAVNDNNGPVFPVPDLPRESMNLNPVTIAILDVFPAEPCGQADACDVLDGKAELNPTFESHGQFVADTVTTTMGNWFQGAPINVVKYAALTDTGVGSVETVIHALHQLYVDQGYDDNSARDNYLVVNLSLNLLHPYGMTHPNYDLQDIPAEVKDALSPPGGAEPAPPLMSNGTQFINYDLYQRMRVPYALAIKAIIGWGTPDNYYNPFDGHVVFVGAAGNERLRNIAQPPSEYPARLNEVISVASTGVSLGNRPPEALYYSNDSSDSCYAFGGDVRYVLPTNGHNRMIRIRNIANTMPADNKTGLPGIIGGADMRWSGSSFSTAIVSGIAAYYVQQDLHKQSPDLISTVCGLAPTNIEGSAGN